MTPQKLFCLAATVLLLGACGEMPLREHPATAPAATMSKPDLGSNAEKKGRTPRRTALPDTGKNAEQTPAIRSPGNGGGAPTAGPAVIALLEQAKSEARNGDGDAAAASLERAIAIEPQNPWLWHRLAVLRLQQERWQQAIDLATKSNTLATDHARLLGGNWKVIAGARTGLGDQKGAEEASVLAQRYFARGGSE